MKEGIAVVTGAAGALGSVVATNLCSAGWDVFRVDRKLPPGFQEPPAQQDSERSRALIADVSDPQQVKQLAHQVAQSGPVRGLVNCAGILGPVGPANSLEVDEWDNILAVNARSAWLTSCAFYPQLKETRGRIVNVSSTAGCDGSPGLVAYSVSKAALLGLTRTLALEWAASGVLVNAVVPGLIESGVSDDLPESTRSALHAKIPLGRAASCKEVAAVIQFLLSSEASYVTGEYWRVDGGR